MKRFILVLFFLLSIYNLSGQEFDVVRHKVEMGETVRMISRKYKVEPAEIYRLNKFAIEGISQGMVLQLLVPKKEVVYQEVPADQPSDEPVPDTQTAAAGEQNERPAVESSSPPDVVAQEITHTVSKGETLYSLARKYNIPVDEIKSQNEEIIKKGLQTGQVLTIRTNN